jgi:hypothetical protein
VLDRNRYIGVVEISIKNTRTQLARQKQILGKLIQRAADYERAKRRVPARILNNMKVTRQRIKQISLAIAQKRAKQDSIRARFAKLMERYRELTGGKTASRKKNTPRN